MNRSEFIEELENVLRQGAAVLTEKNRKYGDSAMNPVRIFSKSSPEEQLRVRLDDKLSRIRSDQLDDDEDTLWDVWGYATLLLMMRSKSQTEQK